MKNILSHLKNFYHNDQDFLKLLDTLAQLQDDRKLAELLGKKERELKSKL
jgi:hypothetical protein